MRVGMMALAVGLGILWVVGMAEGAVSWLVWLDFVAALAAMAVPLLPERGGASLKAPPFVLAFGVGLLWVFALATGVRSSLTWWNFAFAVAFLVLGFAALGEPGGRTITGPRRV